MYKQQDSHTAQAPLTFIKNDIVTSALWQIPKGICSAILRADYKYQQRGGCVCIPLFVGTGNRT